MRKRQAMASERKRRSFIRRGAALLVLLAQVFLAVHQFEHKVHVADRHGELDCAYCIVPGHGGPLPDAVQVAPPVRAVYYVPRTFENQTGWSQKLDHAFRSRAPPLRLS
ncbi:MAG TPA: hypothetical protein VGC92_03465 [Phenylobacterium sp.]|jgi:hypothetical protein